jgi:hypothetical protein
MLLMQIFRIDCNDCGNRHWAIDCLAQGNKAFSLYYAEFQRLIAILKYNNNAKKAALKCGLSCELQAALVNQADEPEDITKFVTLCMKLDYCQLTLLWHL